MTKYLLIIFLITLWPFNTHSVEAPIDMKEFNVNCPANKLCPELEKQYEACKDNPNSGACLKYIEIFKKLVPVYDCQRKHDHTPDKDYIVPAIWMCRPRPHRLWDYIELLSKLEIHEAKEFFASPEFRSILDGELAEAYNSEGIHNEIKEVIQLAIDLPLLQQYYHNRKPLVIEKSIHILGDFKGLTKFGLPVNIMDKHDIEEKNINNFLTIKSWDVHSFGIKAEFEYKIEGIRIYYEFKKDYSKLKWYVDKSRIVEY